MKIFFLQKYDFLSFLKIIFSWMLIFLLALHSCCIERSLSFDWPQKLRSKWRSIWKSLQNIHNNTCGKSFLRFFGMENKNLRPYQRLEVIRNRWGHSMTSKYRSIWRLLQSIHSYVCGPCGVSFPMFLVRENPNSRSYRRSEVIKSC